MKSISTMKRTEVKTDPRHIAMKKRRPFQSAVIGHDPKETEQQDQEQNKQHLSFS
jgi:hypothetical protein